MRMTVIALLLGVSAVARATSGEGDPSQLEASVSTAVAAQQKDWQQKTVGPYPKQSADGVPMVKMRWTPKKGVEVKRKDDATAHPRPDVFVDIFLYAEVEPAIQDLRVAAEGPYNRPTGIVKDLGAEGYAWAGSPRGDSTVRIRVGKSVLEVSGPSVEITMQFATTVVKELEQDSQ